MWYYTRVKAWVSSKYVGYWDGNHKYEFEDGPRFVDYEYSGGKTGFEVYGDVAYYVYHTVDEAHYSVSVSSSSGGTCSYSGSSAGGSRITLSPTPYEGYKFTGYTVLSGSASISGNGFYLYSDVSIRANFTLNDFNLTGASNPAEGGAVIFTSDGSTIITKQTVNKKVYVAHSDTPGWSFQGYTTVPANLSIDENGIFTMPQQHVTITANYKKISAPSLSDTNLTGGGTATLTIAADKTTYTHKYQLSFGDGMETSAIDVAAGTTQVTVQIPLNWSAVIPNQNTKTGGTLTLQTYDGATLLGASQVTGLTYVVPAEVLPTLTALQLDRVLAIEGTTYNSIDSLYIQNHCGVRIRTTAAGAQASTIDSIELTISGYEGNKYNKTQTTGNSIDFTSGLLTAARETQITVKATDSRGRTVTVTGTVDVKAYTIPTGTLEVKRADQYGTEDEMGIYGIYELTKRYTQLGSNSLSWVLAYTGGSASNPADSGVLLPGDTKTFVETQAYTFTLTLQDALETNVITATLPSARFILAFDQSGDKVGVMKFPDKQIPAGKAATFEFSAETQIYIGNKTLEQFIQDVVQSM